MGAEVEQATEQFCAELRKFSLDLERNCKDLRQAAATRSSIYLADDDSADLVEDLQQQVTELERDVEDLEAGTLGTVSFHELLGHFSELYKDIEEGTGVLEVELVKYGYTPVSVEGPEYSHEPISEISIPQVSHQEAPPATPAAYTRPTSGNLQQPPQAYSSATGVGSVLKAPMVADQPSLPAAEERRVIPELHYERQRERRPSSFAETSSEGTKFMNVQDLGLSAATLAMLAEALDDSDDSPLKQSAPDPLSPEAAPSSYMTRGLQFQHSDGGLYMPTRDVESGPEWTSAVRAPPVYTAGPTSGVRYETPAGSTRFATVEGSPPHMPAVRYEAPQFSNGRSEAPGGGFQYNSGLSASGTTPLPAVSRGYTGYTAPSAVGGSLYAAPAPQETPGVGMRYHHSSGVLASVAAPSPAVGSRYASATSAAEAPAVSARYPAPQPSSSSETTAGGPRYSLNQYGAPSDPRLVTPAPGVGSRASGESVLLAPAVSSRFSGAVVPGLATSAEVPAVNGRHGAMPSSSAPTVPPVANGGGSGSLGPLLTSVTAEEFESIMQFHRAGISLKDTNDAIVVINRFMAEKRSGMSAAGQPGLDTFNLDDMARLGLGAKVKTFVMVFHKLNRIVFEQRGPGGSIIYRILPGQVSQ